MKKALIGIVVIAILWMVGIQAIQINSLQARNNRQFGIIKNLEEDVFQLENPNDQREAEIKILVEGLWK